MKELSKVTLPEYTVPTTLEEAGDKTVIATEIALREKFKKGGCMKTIEEKAKAFAKKQTFENRDKFYDEPNLRTSEYLSYKAYLAGYQEAQRWRDVREELPEQKGLIICKNQTLTEMRYFNPLETLNLYSLTERYTHWRPI